MRTIVTGGAGLIGRALSKALAADGHEVVVLSRDPAKVKGMPDGVKVEAWDGKSAAAWGSLADGAFAIINLAGESIASGRWSAERKQLIRSSRVEAGQAVVEAIAAASVKPKVLIQASAVGYYGPRADEIITEDASVGNDFLARVCFDWEASTAKVERAYGVRRAVIRTGIALSTAGGAFPQMVMPFKLFAGGPLGSGEQYLPWIHMDDEVRAIQFLLTNENASGAFNLSAPNPVTSKEFGKVLGTVMGKPAIMPTPGFALKTLFGEMATLLLEGQRQMPKRLLELGFAFKYPELEAALRSLLQK
jgi:hypothetical protein